MTPKRPTDLYSAESDFLYKSGLNAGQAPSLDETWGSKEDISSDFLLRWYIHIDTCERCPGQEYRHGRGMIIIYAEEHAGDSRDVVCVCKIWR